MPQEVLEPEESYPPTNNKKNKKDLYKKENLTHYQQVSYPMIKIHNV